MSWIKIDHTTPDKPEVVRMADMLRIDQDAVTGKLMRVWIWADQNSIDGNALCVSSAFIDRLTARKGFASAMRSVGWLTGEDGALMFPNFDRNNGETAKARAESARRMSKSRASRNEHATPLVAGNVADSAQQKPQPDKSKIREDTENTVEKGPPPPPAGGLSADADLLPVSPRLNEFDTPSFQPPFPLDTPEFAAAWANWLAYRRERKLAAWKPRTVAAKMAEMAAWGHDAAIDSIRQSIANGWQGIFEPKQGGGFQQKTKARVLSTDLSHEQLTKIHKGTF